MKKSSYLLKNLALLLGAILILCTSCKTTDVEEAPQNQAQSTSGATLKTELPAQDWLPPTALKDLTGVWVFKDGSGYEYPVALESKNYFSYHSQPLDRTEYWAQIASEYGMTFEQLWQERATVQFSDDRGNTFPITDETGSRYVLRIRRDANTGAVLFQYWYYVPEAVAARNLNFFRLSPQKNQFYEAGRFTFRGTKINPLQEGNQIYQKRQ